jgi:hypothetical protein
MIAWETGNSFVFDALPGNFLSYPHAGRDDKGWALSRDEEGVLEKASVNEKNDSSNKSNREEKLNAGFPTEIFWGAADASEKEEKENEIFDKIHFFVIDQGPEILHGPVFTEH